MKNIRQSNINIHKDAWVEVNLEHLAHNIQEIRKIIPQNKKFLGIVKESWTKLLCSLMGENIRDTSGIQVTKRHI